ncbi:hypothetical protein [Nocardiopsis sp. Huas11]|uniref:hypothetical protein n=1 Tax=Nocardiopsis sp. Huas11 TaxID=2183912 RepID=UPI0011C382C5|nr:hypothetical protein [Nocardiopsis sp. Huas11]
MNVKRWRQPGTGALLLSLLFAAHVFCAAGAVAAAPTPEAGGTAAVTTATTVTTTAGSADADSPASDGHDEQHPLCPSDANAGPDHRGSALAGAALAGLGTGTALLRVPAAYAAPWQPSTTAAVPWSGTRLLLSLCVLRV